MREVAFEFGASRSANCAHSWKSSMEIVILDSSEAVGKYSALLIARTVLANRRSVLGFATGRTPICVYGELVRLQTAGLLDMSEVVTFNLDEYVGVAASDPNSYASYMEVNLFAKMGIPVERRNLLNGVADDLEHECSRYEAAIAAAGGIDLQLLGIGTEGHIGFNERTSSFGSRTRIKTLTPITRADNASQFDGEVPLHVLTMGIGTILESRHLLLMAFGHSKAAAIAAAVEGPITAMTPASALQLHKRVTIVVDRDAACDLKFGQYYEWVFENKPAWQRLEPL